MATLQKYFIESGNIGIYEQIFENINIIDAHTHIGFDIDGHNLNAPTLLESMKRNEINESIIFPANDPRQGKTFNQPNEVIWRAHKKNPDQFIPFFRLNPNHAWKEEFELD